MSERPERWTEEATQRLISLCQAGITKAAAANEFGCSISRVVAKGRQLNLSFLREDSWTDSDIANLEKLAGEGKTSFEIGIELGRTSSAVEGKAKTWGIHIKSVSEVEDKPLRYGDDWTCTDISLLEVYLSEHYSVDDLVPILGRSSKAIRSKMSVLGLTLHPA